MSSPEVWYKSLPVITRHYFTVCFASTLLVTLGVLNPAWIYLDFDLVFGKFHIWRLITCFGFLGKFSIPTIIQLYLLVNYFRALENGYYATGVRGTAEFLFLQLFGAAIMLIIAFFWGGLYFLGSSLIFMNLYVWSRKDPFQEVVQWGFKLSAWHVPFVLMVLQFLLGGSPVGDIVGILTGHLYHFLTDIVPQKYGATVLRTPQFLYQMFEQGSIRAPQPVWMAGGGNRMQ